MMDGYEETMESAAVCAAAEELTNSAAMLPLPRKEVHLLSLSIVLQTVLFVVVGLVLYGISCLIAGPDLFSELAVGNPPAERIVVVSVAGLTLMILIASAASFIGEKILKKEPEHDGLMGEVVQLPILHQAAWFALTGIGEETLFRLGFMSLVAAIASLFGADAASCALVSVLVSSSVFAALHIPNTKNKKALIAASIFPMGLTLAGIWVLSGSIVAAMAVHAVYDFVAILSAKRKMRKDPEKFFGGKRPYDLMSRVSAH